MNLKVMPATSTITLCLLVSRQASERSTKEPEADVDSNADFGAPPSVLRQRRSMSELVHQGA